MKHYMISEQDLYEILIDLEYSLFNNLERLEIKESDDDNDEQELDVQDDRNNSFEQTDKTEFPF